MPDYLYEVRVYVDVSLLPRGTGGTLLGQQNSNIPGFGPNDSAGAGPMAQTLRMQKREPVGNLITTAPTAAQIQAAIQQAATDLGTALTAPVMATIGNWPLGQQ
jgi:hypothetical protein